MPPEIYGWWGGPGWEVVESNKWEPWAYHSQAPLKLSLPVLVTVPFLGVISCMRGRDANADHTAKPKPQR